MTVMMIMTMLRKLMVAIRAVDDLDVSMRSRVVSHLPGCTEYPFRLCRLIWRGIQCLTCFAEDLSAAFPPPSTSYRSPYRSSSAPPSTSEGHPMACELAGCHVEDLTYARVQKAQHAWDGVTCTDCSQTYYFQYTAYVSLIFTFAGPE